MKILNHQDEKFMLPRKNYRKSKKSQEFLTFLTTKICRKKIGQKSQDFLTFLKKVVKQLSGSPIHYIRSNIIKKYTFWQKKIFKKIPAWGGWMLYAQEGSKILGQKMFQNGVLTLGNIYPNPSKVFSDPINDKLWQKIKTSRNLDFLGQTAEVFLAICFSCRCKKNLWLNRSFFTFLKINSAYK